MSIKKAILARVRLTFLVLVGVAFLVAVQIMNLQWVQGSFWYEKAKESGLKYRTQKATRGNIYADDGVLLATSIPLYKVSIDPVIVTEEIYKTKLDSLTKLLAGFFQDKPARDYVIKINDARKARKRYVTLGNRPITFSEKQKLEKWPIFRDKQNGVSVMFEKVEERVYPFEELGARSIGYVNELGEGVGLEISFQKELGGEDGLMLYQRLMGGEWKPVRSGVKVRTTDGKDVYSTLNVNIQHLTHEALMKGVKMHKAKYGCAIVMDVETGEIKAIANLGRATTNDVDTSGNAVYKFIENYNYALGDQVSDAPGSTFKTASMLALMEDTLVNLKDTIDIGNGTYQYYDRLMQDAKGLPQKITVQQAFEQSSNVGVSLLVSRHFGRKESKYIDYLQKFKLSTPLESVRLVGLAKPYIKTPQDATWSGVTLPWMSVGYESKISPLQVLAFHNAIANNGVFVHPRLVRGVRMQEKYLIKYPILREEKPICSPQNLEKIKAMLEGVVERGTAKNIKTDKYKIAGKTGTSKKLNERGKYVQKYRTSFVGYFPANKPKYSCIVVIDEPQGAEQYGGDVCAPIFRDIADRLYAQDADVQSKPELKRETPVYQTNLPTNHAGYIDDFKSICAELNISSQPKSTEEIVSPVGGRYTVDWQARKVGGNTVPNVKGLSLRDAVYLLENKGLKVYVKGQGRVKTQSLAVGSPLRKGEKIVINLE
ncbi:MAG: PASTA domain-containing protein [Bacteroidetes bacterium]|nr:MAG: PASTA domain-containing protein [Bacteroidota bacterium]